ncbi:MAG: lgt prolipoprotein diacylglyceryl transferase [Bacteroidota bacterium]|nr:lgt prolipoprotein diacylglyceryl transferase [Bacteroidota bacterium]
MNSLLAFVIHWNVKPEIFMITENFGIRWYSLLYGAAFFIGYNILYWEFKKENENTEGADQLLMYMFFAILIGARLGHCFFYDWAYYSKHLIEIPQVWKGGLASHGAAIAIPIGLYLYKRKHPEQTFLWIIDRVAIPTAIGGSFIRYGNFFNSEIVGDYTNGSWGIVFERLGETLPRVPIMLFEAFLYDFIFIVILTIYIRAKYKPREGSLMAIFLFMMFAGRFFLEYWKVDVNPLTIMGVTLTHGQWLSIPFIIISFVIYGASIKNSRKQVVVSEDVQ